MKFKKGLLQTIIMGTALVGILSISTTSQAAINTSGKLLKLNNPTYRASGYAYRGGLKSASGIKTQDMWKIYEYNSNGGTIKNLNNGIYCLKMGVGFGSAGGSATQERTYNVYADMKNPAEADKSIISSYKATLPSTENYNAIVWILDHSYVPASSTSPTAEQIANAAAFKQELLTNAGIPNSKMNDDLIDIVQQVAIWYFTNNDQYKADEITTVQAKLASQLDYDSVDDVFNNWDLSDDIDTLYNYFITNAEANKNVDPSTTATNPVKFTSNTSRVTLNGDYYIAGPYKIEQLSDKVYTLDGMLVSANNQAISYTLLDSNKQDTTKTLKELMGENFYLKIPSTQNIENSKFKVVTRMKQNTVTYWTVSNPNNDQPVAEVIPEEKVFEEEVTLNLSNFDLALRKFIIKINDVNVDPSREPVVTEQTIEALKNKTITTVTKTHTKTPIQVKIGDTVLYTIRIYNEGDIDGYAKEITDYLPEGLTLKQNSTINTENGWTNPSGDGKTIVTNKLENRLLAKFNGSQVDYADVQVECIVNAQASEFEQSLKNVAEITSHTDESGNTITDRDSVPKDLTDDQKNNYNPGTSEEGWGYEDDDDYEELILPGKPFDLALRKFITNVNGKELVKQDGTYLREPTIDLTPLINGTGTTAEYKHPKNPVGVAVGDIVIYTLRIYNEGEIDGYASKVTDYLPPQLEFVIDDEENFNAKYGWVVDTSLRKASTSYLAKPTIDPEDTLIKAFDGTTLDYKELKIKCRVKSTKDLEKVITNIAEITEFTDANGNTIRDRDSQKENVVLPSDENLPDYKGNASNKSILTDSNYHYKGQQDDDDFEKLILEEFDLALRKFITKINETPVTNRVPVFTNAKDENGNYIYEHTKEPIEVNSTDIVEYTLRIYNEGDIAGYAKEIKDDIPEGLEFLPENDTNIEYRWIMLDENGEKTTDVSKAKCIVTDYLSKEQEKTSGANLIQPFDNTRTSPDFKEVKIAFKVVAPNTHIGIITNTAEISDDSDENGKNIDDRDSTPDNNNPKEDDIDVEHIKLSYFDLALRKFITAVNDKEITNRVPKFKIDENGNYVYEHTKEPVEVVNGDIVTYTIRVFNEGTKDGYAKEVKDDLPEGLEFLPDNETNKTYRWVMLDKDGKETTNVKEAVSIKTDYLSKEQEDETGRNNLLVKFDNKTMQEPNYKDIKIAFKITEPNTSDRILINKAQISNDSDKDGKDVIDIDSTPDKWIDGEDDQDIEKVKVKYFDLALRKWVTEAIVIDNGKETVIQTGHKPEDDPEEVVKVEIRESRLNKVVVKFRYSIRVYNEGEIAGYAKEVKDYIPEGLKFVQADNPEWKQLENGDVVTEQLKDTLLQPGEYADVEILLTWINGKNNFGLKVNVAEISKDYNDSNTPDIDSTPDNKKDDEDDIDDAPVILTIKTGAGLNTEYIAVITVTLTILASGVILIKKYVL